jgi:RecB family exonuclease
VTALKPEPNWTLPAGFHFTQSKLQDFVDCPWRFYLSYVLNQQWPAPLAEPQAEVEQALERGARFHQMVERHQLGVPLDALYTAASGDPILAGWLKRYQAIFAELGPFERAWPEVELSAVVAGYPVVAKYDLIGLQGETVLALDWKTGRLPDAVALERRMQTIVYLLVLRREAARLAGRPVETATLHYVRIPSGEKLSFTATETNLRSYEERVRGVIESIHASDFALTDDVRFCRFCRYRGLCERGLTLRLSPDDVDFEDLWGADWEESDPSVVEF